MERGSERKSVTECQDLQRVKKGGKNIRQRQQLKARQEGEERRERKKGVGEVLIGGRENGGAGGVC